MERAIAACVLLAAIGGCQGEIVTGPAGPREGSARADGNGQAARPSARDLECNPDEPKADTTPARILTQKQYNNAIRDLFGEGLPQLGQSTVGSGPFDNAVAAESSSVIMPELRSTAESVAAAVFEGGFDPGCDSSMSDRQCASHFVRTYGRRLFRRPVTAEGEQTLLELYDEIRAAETSGAHESALQAVLSAMLQMPRFLYRIEGGASRDQGRIALDGYEMASRLSFFLWNTIPDAQLLDAAEQGQLERKEGVRRAAERMLDDPRARQSISHMYTQILGLDRVPYLVKDPQMYGDFDQHIGELMRRETLAFLEEVIFERNGTVADLYQSDFTMLNGELARFYGIEGVSGEQFRPVELQSEQRGGLLTHGSFLAQYGKQRRTNPITRGVHVIRNALCWSLPDPPGNIPALEQDVSSGSSVREQLASHKSPGCASCHKMIDPIGLAFESFDTTGQLRSTDTGGNPVNTHTELKTPWGQEIALDGPGDLSAFIAESADSEICMTRDLFANAFARMPQDMADRCLVERLRGGGEDESVPIREMLVRITTSEMFRHKMNESAEVCE
jgi:hypothetical protein